MPGTLYLCPTPIGNLEDITARTLRVLKEADLICCEDTRTSQVLLKHFDIHTPLMSYHKFNETERADGLVERLQNGENIALISDAGMPGISDPGEILVRKAKEASLVVTALPGPSACVTALAMSGLPTRRFAFEGFLPQDKKEKDAVLERLANTEYTTIFYEAPHRLVKTLTELAKVAGSRRAAVVREISKRYEEAMTVTLGKLLEYYSEHEPKGEFVVLVEGISREELETAKTADFLSMTIAEHMALYKDMDEKEAMKRVAEERGISKRDVYRELKT